MNRKLTRLGVATVVALALGAGSYQLARHQLLSYLEVRLERVGNALIGEHVQVLDERVGAHDGAGERVRDLYARYELSDLGFIPNATGFVTVRESRRGYEIVAATSTLSGFPDHVADGAPGAELMRLATRQRGSWRGDDVRGKNVIAAYRPLATQGWGTLIIFDMDVLAAPYLRAAFASALILLVALAAIVGALTRVQGRGRDARALLDHLTGLTEEGLLLAQDGDVIGANPAAAAMFGYDRARDLEGRNMSELLPESLDSGFASGRAALHQEGFTFPVSVDTGRVRAKGGQLSTFLIRDQTQSVEQEEARRRSERRYREVLERSPSPITIVTDDGTHLYQNAAYGRCLEMDVDALVGRRLDSYVVESSRAEAAAFLERVIAEQEADATLHVETATGRQRILGFRGRTYEHEKGVSYLLLGAVDTTALVQAHEAVEVAHDELSQIVSALPSILVGLTPDQRVWLWNDSATDAFGISPEGAEGKLLTELPLGWDPTGVIDAATQVHAAGSGSLRLHDLTWRRPTGDDGVLGVTVHLSRSRSGDACVLLLASDVTELRAQENRQRQTQKLESIGQLAAGVAHEINTPTQYVGDNVNFLKDAFADLFGVLEHYEILRVACQGGEGPATEALEALAQVLEDSDIPFLEKEIPKAIAQAGDGVQRVSKIVRAMKAFSHPGSEDKTLTDINECIRSTMIVASNEWKYVAELELELEEGLPRVPCYPAELNQVLLNLVVNAAHAISDLCEGEDAKGRITIGTRLEDDHLLIRVSDTGGGVPDEIRERIFDPFFTTKEVGKGTGQGLSIAHSIIVERHGGSLDVEVEPGVGSAFLIQLPLASEAEGEDGVIG